MSSPLTGGTPGYWENEFTKKLRERFPFIIRIEIHKGGGYALMESQMRLALSAPINDYLYLSIPHYLAEGISGAHGHKGLEYWLDYISHMIENIVKDKLFEGYKEVSTQFDNQIDKHLKFEMAKLFEFHADQPTAPSAAVKPIETKDIYEMMSKLYGAPTAPGTDVSSKLTSVLPGIQGAKVARCPADQGKMKNGKPCALLGQNNHDLFGLIIHLNDQHAWPREQIADWLESLDIDLQFKEG